MNPWPETAPVTSPFALLRWQWQRLRHGVPPAPAAGSMPVGQPAVAHPAAAADETRLTWLGQSAFLLQAGEVTLLTDPMLSMRASPLPWAGPARVVPPPLTVRELPPVHGVLLSHDHYDHLDAPTFSRLLARFGPDLPIFTPLGFRAWFARIGARNIIERDWWEAAPIPGTGVELTFLPTQHWSRRGPAIGTRLWGSWLVRAPRRSIYFCGDSAYCPAFREIGARVGPPDIALMPIGAYEPRWFMKPAHMNPEESVRAFLDLGARDFVAMHWGTFRLTDEPMLEPPERVRREWRARGLPESRLHVPAHGETLGWRHDGL